MVLLASALHLNQRWTAVSHLCGVFYKGADERWLGHRHVWRHLCQPPLAHAYQRSMCPSRLLFGSGVGKSVGVKAVGARIFKKMRRVSWQITFLFGTTTRPHFDFRFCATCSSREHCCCVHCTRHRSQSESFSRAYVNDLCEGLHTP